MRLSSIVTIVVMVLSACEGKTNNNDHGHEHGPGADHSHGPDGHTHEQGDHLEQEEFTVTSDTTQNKMSLH